MFGINQILKMQVDETGEATDTFLNPMAGMSIVAQDLANLYGESSVSEPSNAEPVRPPDVIDEDELSDESWAKQIQPKLELEEQTNTCAQCGLTFKNRQSLRRHKSTHSDFKPFRCDMCDYSSTLKEYLRKHMKFRHKKDLTNELSRPNKRLPIPTTSQLSKAGPKFDYTIKKNKNTPTTTSRVAASWIVNLDATGKRSFKCRKCDYVCPQSKHLKQHERTHAGNKFQCQYCNFYTIYKRSLSAHINQHMTSFKIKCYLCPVGFIRGSDLLDHISKAHPKLENFCKVCKVYFQTVKDYDSHLSIHFKTCRIELGKLSLEELANSKATFPTKTNTSIEMKDSPRLNKLSNVKTYDVKNGRVSKLEAALTKSLPEKKSTVEKLESAHLKSSVVIKTTPLNVELIPNLVKKTELKEPVVRITKLEEALVKSSLPVPKTTPNSCLDKISEVNEPISSDDVTKLVVVAPKPTPVSKPITASASKTTEKSATITPSISDPSNELIEDDLYLIVEEEDVPQCSAEVIEEIDISDSDTDDNLKRNQTTQPIVISLPLQNVNVQSAIPTNCAATYSIPKQSFPTISGVTGNFPFYKCDLCPFSSQSELSLRHHSWNHHSLNLQQMPKRFIKCDFCPQSFERRCDVLKHQQSHLSVKNFKCEYCSQMFERKDEVLKHMNICIGVQFLNSPAPPTYVVH